MYLHIGLNYVINTDYIVGIFDIEITSSSQITKKFLSYAQKRNEIVSVTAELPKSYILYRENGITQVYLTQLSVMILLKRLETGQAEQTRNLYRKEL